MNRSSLFYIISAGFIVAILGISYFLLETFRNDNINEEIGTMVKNQLQITLVSKQVFEDAQEMESSIRGFIITGDEIFLSPYKSSIVQSPLDINLLKKITVSDREKSQIVNSLAILFERKIKFSQNIVSLGREGKINEAKDFILTGEGKRLMENIRTIISKLDNDSRNTLNGFYVKKVSTQNKSRRNYAILSVLILSLLLFFYVFIILDLKRREKIKLRLHEAGEEIRDLYDFAPSGYISVDPMLNIIRINDTALRWLNYTHDEISKISKLELLVSPNSVPLLNKLKENENIINLEIELTGRNNSLPVLIDATARKNAQGIIIEKRIILTDIRVRKKTEEENRYLARLIDETSDAIISTDKSLFIRSWNKGAEKMFGYTSEEAINKETSILRSSLVPEERKAILEELMAKGSWHGEFYNYSKEGKQLFINSSTTTVHDDDGHVTGYVHVMQDISPRKMFEEKLQNFNKELIENVNQKTQEISNILERLTDGFASIDKEYNITYINNTAAKIFGIQKSDVIGKNLTKVFAKEDNSIRRAYKKAFETQTSFEIEDYYDYFKKWYYFVMYPSPEGVSFFFRDVTKRRESEDKLKENEKQYRYLFENNPLPMFIMDIANCIILDVNNAAVSHYGYSRIEFERKKMIDLMRENEKEKFSDFKQLLDCTDENVNVWNHVKKDGTSIQVEILSYETKYNDQPGRLIIANDITEKINYENELRNSRDQLRLYSINLEKEREEERTYIAQEIHDELGQHLTGLKLDLSWFLKKMINEPAEYVEKISGMIELVDETVKSVRRIALELRPGMIDDLGLASAIDWQAKEFYKRSGITCRIHSDLSEQYMDKSISIGVFRIFQEALTNVARHANATKVDCTLTLDDHQLNLTITDNGLGLLPNVDKKRTLGLLGMYERALTMKGNLAIESKPGEGTKINLTVPLNS